MKDLSEHLSKHLSERKSEKNQYCFAFQSVLLVILKAMPSCSRRNSRRKSATATDKKYDYRWNEVCPPSPPDTSSRRNVTSMPGKFNRLRISKGLQILPKTRVELFYRCVNFELILHTKKVRTSTMMKITAKHPPIRVESLKWLEPLAKGCF